MPLLSKEDRKRMLGPQDTKCPKCNANYRKNYCRECDEFFYECNCAESDEQHRGHRTY